MAHTDNQESALIDAYLMAFLNGPLHIHLLQRLRNLISTMSFSVVLQVNNLKLDALGG